jgi:cellulose synthase operon protein C
LKWFRERGLRVISLCTGALLTVCVCVGAVRPLWRGTPLLSTPGHGIERWIENVQSGSEIEQALYRTMQLPGGDILFRRAPRETIPALSALAQTQKAGALYSLRALEEEQALDFIGAERDWKTWADQAEDRTGAQIDLADFYERRLQPQPELVALESVGEYAPDARERWTAVESQRAWKAFERELKVVDEYALVRSESARIYAAWITRYPQEPSLYERQFTFLLAGKDFSAASDLIARYRTAFPADHVFPVKAEADLAVRRGQPRDGLAIYEARFEPLWPAQLVKSYFSLVIQSHSQRAFNDALRAKLAANPDDLRDAGRLFYLYQQQGQLDSAKAVLSRYREQKESRGGKWTEEELDTLEKLFEAIQDFPEAARYAYALAASHSAPNSERAGVVALARILLTAPEQPLRVGAGNLALYQNIATMDGGPGYLNGILSLLLNTQGPRDEFATEDQLATPYFHRARAAELVEQIDQRFSDDPSRSQLHAGLMEAYAAYGENAAVIYEGTAILAQFPQFADRVRVAMALADAYERTRQVDKEFTLYQDLLKELAAQADGVPLGGAGDAYSKPIATETALRTTPALNAHANDNTNAGEDAGTEANIGAGQQENDEDAAGNGSNASAKAALTIRSAQYAQVLDRYLARLVALHRLPDALSVLRGELDRNPRDPGLYQRLADFLEQNSLNSHEEEVYQRAIQQFQDTGWNAKLARYYLRLRRTADYRAQMQKVANIFSGTELEAFLEQAPAPDQSLAREVNLYANQRFPHDLRFVQHLISEYTRTRDDVALEKLLWLHWSENPELRSRLFELLSKTHRLDSQLEMLRQQAPEIDKGDWAGIAERNPAAERFWLESCLWRSHFEQGVSAADALAAAYPADSTLGEQASSLYRSLAYFHPEDTDKAVAIQRRLLDAQPGKLDTLARIGDIYADHERFAEAAPFWVRMAEVHPGEPDGYLQSATVFWDYFAFASAQEQLQKARARLNRPTLFGYQEGAIEESRGDFPAAVRAYTASAVAEDQSVESRDRLLALARRPALRTQLDAGTSGLLQQASPGPGAIQLRAGILEAEHRKDDLVRELDQAIAETGSFDVLDAVANAARSHALPQMEEAALRRQIALTTDPVRGLQLRYQLVDLLQLRNPSAAAQEVDAIYHDQSRILGVVRSTVDYDWAHERRPQAVSVLLESAQVSYPELKSRFELEAARKLTELGETSRSHSLLAGLLNQKPLEAEYEAAMADNFAHANDQPGLEAFYRVQLELVRKATLNHDEKQQRIGQLRRGVIAAATLLGNFNDAVDQYIELINAFPDDAGLVQEASLFAVSHNARGRLFDFYQKTITDSPRDPRWSIVLARLATAAEDDALAIDAYSKALQLRPERQDLYIAQASLDERLHRLDDAIALYRKLYLLSYRDPKWMERVAELCARQGRGADAVKALETGWIEGKPKKAANAFAVAERLEKWDLLEEAQQFASQGVELAGSDLLASEQAGAATYGRIMARQRQSTVALARLLSAREQAPKVTLAAVAQQVVKEGAGAVTSAEWRKQREDERRTHATSGFAQALKAIGSAVGEFYTPEEKVEFAALLKQHSAAANAAELDAVYLPAVKAAGLADLTADLMWTVALQNGRLSSSKLSEWIDLEKRRVQMDSAAAQMEKSVLPLNRVDRNAMWQRVADAYRDAGDIAGELRATEHVYERGSLQSEPLARYYRLQLAQHPQRLVSTAAALDSAAQYLVRNGTVEQALNGIQARSAGKPSVWKDAYTALTGLYLREYRPEINTAFSTALNTDANIGERIAHAADRSRQLAGRVWFYYGSRYGEYLNEEKDPRSEEYLESDLELTPGNSTAYLRLADYFAATSRPEPAMADYQHSLDLNRDQPVVLDSIATLQWDQGRQAEALTAWNEAVKRLAEEMDARRVPETFWGNFARLLGNITAHSQFPSLREPVDAMLRIYVARNGDYRAEPLLEAGYHANRDSVDWLLSITAGAPNQRAVLSSILPNRWSQQGKWIEKTQLGSIYARLVELAQTSAQANPGPYDEGLDSARRSYVETLLKEKNIVLARGALAQVPEARRNSAEWLASVLAVADADGTLDSLLVSWKREPGKGPADVDLRSATAVLNGKASGAVRRFIYERALDRHELTAANFLGLAAIHLDAKDTTGAVELLKRLTLVSDNIYADTDAAAQLLEEHHKEAEALEFLRPLVGVSPWNAGYKVRLAKAMLAVNRGDSKAFDMLNSVAGNQKAAYRDRVAAAGTLKGHGALASGSDELKLLAQAGCPDEQSTSKPLFVEARAAAASCATSPKIKERLLRDAVATDPDAARVRLEYIWVAFGANFDSRALVAAQSYLRPNYYNASYNNPQSDADDSADSLSQSSADESQDQHDEPGAALTLATLRPAQLARLVQLASDAYERRRDFTDASHLVAMALEITYDAANHKVLVEKQKHLDIEVARSHENNSRAPNIHAELDQDRIVRPRLLPGMPVPTHTAKPTGTEDQ